MSAEQAIAIFIACLSCVAAGFQWATVRAKRASTRDESKQKQQQQDSAAILALANAFGPLISQMQDQTLAIRANTQVTHELVQQIAKTNENDTQQRATSLEGQVELTKHISKNTANLQELSETFNKVGSDLKRAIETSKEDVSENSRNLAQEIKGAVADQATKLDSAIAPLTKEFQEAIVALTKALELLTLALGKINDIGANQEEIKKLVEQARTEIKEQLAKPVPADVLPGPPPPAEPPKEPSTP